jgi:hypothetical protein
MQFTVVQVQPNRRGVALKESREAFEAELRKVLDAKDGDEIGWTSLTIKKR